MTVTACSYDLDDNVTSTAVTGYDFHYFGHFRCINVYVANVGSITAGSAAYERAMRSKVPGSRRITGFITFQLSNN